MYGFLIVLLLFHRLFSPLLTVQFLIHDAPTHYSPVRPYSLAWNMEKCRKNNFSNSFVGQSTIFDISSCLMPMMLWWTVCAAPLKLRIQRLRGSWWYCSSSCVWIKYIIICRRMERMVAIKKTWEKLCLLHFAHFSSDGRSALNTPTHNNT